MIAKKVLLVGHFGVGKTSLITRFVLNGFSKEYISTIGVRVSKKEIQLNNQTVKLLIWDVAGTGGNEKIPKSYFLGASAIMYVFDLSREETYTTIEDYLLMIKELSGVQNIIVIGNKKDLLTEKEILEVKSKITIHIDLITSAKEDTNVEDAFTLLAINSLK